MPWSGCGIQGARFCVIVRHMDGWEVSQRGYEYDREMWLGKLHKPIENTMDAIARQNWSLVDMNRYGHISDVDE
jgi:hypothetical protein